jgi:hypothetical protein
LLILFYFLYKLQYNFFLGIKKEEVGYVYEEYEEYEEEEILNTDDDKERENIKKEKAEEPEDDYEKTKYITNDTKKSDDNRVDAESLRKRIKKKKKKKEKETKGKKKSG